MEGYFEALRKSINRLPALDRLIIPLVLEEKSYKEIAEIIGLTLSYTGVKISRIKTRLMTLMQR